MESIRNILKEKDENFSDNSTKLDEIEKLINEMKIAELEFTECEEKEAMRKALLEDLILYFNKLSDINRELHFKNSEIELNLIPLFETLKMMIDHEDYIEDQEFILNLKDQVAELIDEAHKANNSLESSKELIEEILSQDSEYEASIEIHFLESKLNNINKVTNKLESAFTILNTISTQTTEHRKELEDAFIERNHTQKQQNFKLFTVELASVKGKIDMIMTRVNQEKQDQRLQDSHRGILTEVEANLQEIQSKIDELKYKEKTDEEILQQVQAILLDSDLKISSCEDLQKTIKLLEQVKVSEVDAFGPVQRISAALDDAILSLDKIDYAQENNPCYNLLEELRFSADELLKNVRFIKSVFDSTEGYTSSQEEDSAYDKISRDLGDLIVKLLDVIEKVDAYKNTGEFENINAFLSEQDLEVQQIQESLFNHCLVLQQIPWEEKLGRRIEELKEEQGDIEDILNDGNKIFEELKTMKEKASKNEEKYEELLKKLELHISRVSGNLEELEGIKEELDSINEDILEFEGLIDSRNDGDFQGIVKILKKNKEIKEKYLMQNNVMDSLDAEIDEISSFIAENKNLI